MLTNYSVADRKSLTSKSPRYGNLTLGECQFHLIGLAYRKHLFLENRKKD